MHRRERSPRIAPPKIAIAAGCLGLSISAGLLASAYTTAGLDPFYMQQRERADDGSSSRAQTPDTGGDARAVGTGASEISYPPIPNSR